MPLLLSPVEHVRRVSLLFLISAIL